MIRINRLIKRDSLFKLLDLPHVAKVEIIRRKSNQKDKTKIRVCIYLTHSHAPDERTKFKATLGSILVKANITDEVKNTIQTAIKDGFIKESTYNSLGIDTKYSELCNTYNQEFFDSF